MDQESYFAKGKDTYFSDRTNGFAEECSRNFPIEAENVKRTADRVCENNFIFTDKWDLEQAPFPVSFSGEIDWERNPKGDPEYIWQFNRHRYFICLGQAYQMTGDEKYAEKYVDLLTDWINRIPLTKEHEEKAWRSLEAGFRGENWTKAILYFKDSPALNDDVITRYYESLLVHAAYLEQKHSDYKCISNWGIIENHGLFEIALALVEPELQTHYVKLALEHLSTAARLQIMEDGIHWEQSPLYHCEVARCFLDVLLLAKKHKVSLPEGMEARVRSLLYVMRDWKKPDGHIFLNGDSDDVDMDECFILGAYYFSDQTLKAAVCGRMNYEAAWSLGPQGIVEYEALSMQQPGHVSAAFSDGGQYYLRSGWEKNANLLHFSCGTLGAGHGHTDKLHVDLVMEGRDVLVDAGRYTYAMPFGRIAFKDPKAHNTITVDGRPYTICKDSWTCEKLTQPVNTAHRFTGAYEYVQGGHIGYIEDGVLLNRRIIYLKPDIYLIADEMYAGNAHTYETYFHFNEGGHVRMVCDTPTPEKGAEKKQSAVPDHATGTADCVRAVYEDTVGDVQIFFCAETLENGSACMEQTKSQIARHYNSKAENDCLVVKQQAQGFTSLYTLFAGNSVKSCRRIPVSSALKGTIYGTQDAEALQIKTDRTSYIIIVCHREVNSPTDLTEAAGCRGFGNVIVFDKSRETLGGTVLHW